MKCPHCNHEFEKPLAGECPRCGEALLTRTAQSEPAWRRSATSVDLGSVVKARVKQAMIVTLLIFLVIGGIAFKMIRDERKKQHEPPPRPVERPNRTATRPAELQGLRHIPARSNLVAAIQFGPLLAYAERTKQDPVEMLTGNGVPAAVLAVLAKAGVTLQQMDYVVAGIGVPDKDEEARIAFVVVFKPLGFAAAPLLENLKAKPNGKPGREEVQFDKVTLQLNRVSDAVWVFGLSEKDFHTSPPPSHFLGMIETWVPHDAAVWIAADSVAWTKKPIVEALLKGAAWKPADLALLGKGRAATIGYSFGDSPRLHVSVQCDTSESAAKLRTYFKGKATGERSSAAGTADWATLELPAEPKEVTPLLKGFLDDARR